MSQKKQRERVSRDQWLQAALDVLAREGVNGVKIDRLARQLGVAKTGFYWHFRNRQDLLDTLIEYWESQYTNVIANSAAIRAMPPAERLAAINRQVNELDLTKFERAIADWAQHDTRVASLRARAIATRLSTVKKAFRELGFSGDDLEMRTRLFVCYVTSEADMFGPCDSAKDRKRRRLRNQLLMQPLLQSDD